MQDQLKEKQLKSADSSIAAALLYSEYLKGQSAINSSSKLSLSNWVRTGSQKNGI
jgi:hypothetical protein